MSESFTKSWWGRVRSSEGYSVRVLGRTGIDYRDRHGRIRIDAEAMSSPWNAVVVYTRSVADTPDRPKAEVLDRVRRAWEFAGWQLPLEDA